MVEYEHPHDKLVVTSWWRILNWHIDILFGRLGTRSSIIVPTLCDVSKSVYFTLRKYATLHIFEYFVSRQTI